MTKNDLKRFISTDDEFADIDISRISSSFIVQIIQLRAGGSIETVNIVKAIKSLENNKNTISTKSEDCFKHQPLKGLYKKHFFDANFVLKNIGTYWGMGFGGNDKLDKMIKQSFAKSKTGYCDDRLNASIISQLTFGAIKDRTRSKKLTGEWIIYQKYQNKNYYLTIASHDEKDIDIHKRIKDIYYIDFDFLKTNCQDDL